MRLHPVKVILFAFLTLVPCHTRATASPADSSASAASAAGDPSRTSDVEGIDWSQWFPVPNDYDTFAPTPIDQSASMDAPAGKHGFMKNVDGHWVFADGSPVRLMAVVQSPIVPRDKKQADYLARWIAKWGINAVRFHPVADDVTDKIRGDTGHLDPAKMDLLDYFIDQLAQRGVYVHFSLIYYRKLSAGDGADMAGKDKLDSMGIGYFDPKVMQSNINLETLIMTHRNPYRNNVMYGDDPAICQLETTNEDSTFFYTIDGIPDPYKKELDRQWTDWLLRKYGTREKISAAWGHPVGDGPIARLIVWQYSHPIAGAMLKQAQDQLRFYAYLNNTYYNKTRLAMRNAGVKQPICGSGWQGVGSSNLTDLFSNVAGMDYVDRHHYWGGGSDDWRLVPSADKDFEYSSVLQKPEKILQLGMERVLTLPFTITEWADVLPTQSRLASPPLMAFYGSCLNGWDTPFDFAQDMTYWNGDTGFTKRLYWLWPVNEASTLCQFPALATLIRRMDIDQAPLVYARNYTPAEVFGAEPLAPVTLPSGSDETNSVPESYSAAVGKVGIRFTDNSKPTTPTVALSKYIDAAHKTLKSVTGQLTWDYGTGYVLANTPRTQAAVGFLSGVDVRLKDCAIQTTNSVASIIVSSWDGQPLKFSKHILITAVGRCRNTGMAYSKDGHRLLALGDPPVLLEGVKGSVTLWRGGPCTVTALGPAGYKTVDVTPFMGHGLITIPMDGANKAAYYDVVFP